MYAIKNSLNNYYSVDIYSGNIRGIKGKNLTIKLRGKQKYATVSLVVKNMKRRFYSVPVHKVIAYAIWKEEAFKPGICVRHLDSNTLNNTKENLRLGTHSDNEQDKSPKTKSNASKLARKAQGKFGLAIKLTKSDRKEIKHLYYNGNSVPRLAKRFNVCRTTIYNCLRVVTYNEK